MTTKNGHSRPISKKSNLTRNKTAKIRGRSSGSKLIYAYSTVSLWKKQGTSNSAARSGGSRQREGSAKMSKQHSTDTLAMVNGQMTNIRQQVIVKEIFWWEGSRLTTREHGRVCQKGPYPLSPRCLTLEGRWSRALNKIAMLKELYSLITETKKDQYWSASLALPKIQDGN